MSMVQVYDSASGWKTIGNITQGSVYTDLINLNGNLTAVGRSSPTFINVFDGNKFNSINHVLPYEKFSTVVVPCK